MSETNLLPAYRVHARREQRLRRWCLAAVLVYATGAFAIVTGAGAVFSASARPPAIDPATLEAEVALKAQALETLRPKLADAERRLAAQRRIVDRPDFSLLMRLLADRLDDDLVLRSCRLTPIDPPPPAEDDAELPPAPPVPGGYELTLEGLAKSPPAVSRYVLKLERLGVFDRVSLVDSRAAGLAGIEATAFTIRCRFAEPVEATP